MWRSKKFIIIAVLVVVALAGTIGGVALAQGNGDENTQPEAQQAALLEKVCEIYEDNTGTAINADDLKDAFVQAAGEMREEALESRLQGLVDDGKITQEQADELLDWWQSRPEDLPFALGPGSPGMGGMNHGFGGPGGFGGCFGPPQPAE
jgi:hypothetical protein